MKIMKKIKTILSIRFNPDQYTWIAFGLAVLSFILSLMLNFTNNHFLWFFIRDVLQIIIIGLLIPLYILSRKNEFKKTGLRFDKSWLLLIGLFLAGLLLLQFISEGGTTANLNLFNLDAMFYVMVANIFEIIFFAGFLRNEFEKAFGIIPAIILASLFFSLHHAGFQPEFLKLFFVGLFFISIMRIPNHWFIIIPAWWIGGVWDVLVKAQNIVDITKIGWIRPSIILLAIILLFYKFYSCKRIEVLKMEIYS